MSNTTQRELKFEEIKASDLFKIIVIGGGGLGKTTLVNLLTDVKFDISKSSQDGTFDFQGTTFNKGDGEIVIVDSPGYRLNEDRWWNGIMQIQKIIGVIIMHKYEPRNSGYGSFGYVLLYLNQQKDGKVQKFLLDNSTTTVASENYMANSTQVKPNGIDKCLETIQKWIRQLDHTIIEIFSPTALIDQYKKKLNEIKTLEETHQQLKRYHEETIIRSTESKEKLKRECEELRKEKQIVEESKDQLEAVIDELPSKLACFDDNTKGYLVDAPNWLHYLYSWLPITGLIHLNSLRAKAEKDHKIAMDMMEVKKKKQKKLV